MTMMVRAALDGSTATHSGSDSADTRVARPVKNAKPLFLAVTHTLSLCGLCLLPRYVLVVCLTVRPF